VRRAIRSVALGRVPDDERVWIERIEARRRELASSPRTISFPVLGTMRGEPSGPTEPARPRVVQQAVSRWSRESSVTPMWGSLLMRLVRELRPSSCLELGTGFGLSGAYQAAALELNGRGHLVTLDGAVARAEIAEEGFAGLGLAPVEVRVGSLSEILDTELARADPVDYAFVDANHDEDATRHYFDSMAPHLADTAVVVFDDINWSPGMRRAWTSLHLHPNTALAIGAGRVGICVTRRLPGDGEMCGAR
jgi:predicted O-methyltransferase YrrM